MKNTSTRSELQEALHENIASNHDQAAGTSDRTLLERLWEREAGRLDLLEDCCALIETHVVARRGLPAATVRACYRTVQSLKPGLVGYEVGKLMPDFLIALEPMFRDASSAAEQSGADLPTAFRLHLEAAPEKTVNALLGVTDARIHSARMPIRSAYKTIRHGAVQPVLDALPALAGLLEKHLQRS